LDNKAIIGSANVSSNSVDNLIETAILTDDSKTVLDAGKFISDHCIEKVELDNNFTLWSLPQPST
jgi:deoxycytidine triphosphate deaminase